jgi:hypothetical protein
MATGLINMKYLFRLIYTNYLPFLIYRLNTV